MRPALARHRLRLRRGERRFGERERGEREDDGGLEVRLLKPLGGWTGMHLQAAIAVYTGQALWAALVGWPMPRGALDAPSNPGAASPKD